MSGEYVQQWHWGLNKQSHQSLIHFTGLKGKEGKGEKYGSKREGCGMVGMLGWPIKQFYDI